MAGESVCSIVFNKASESKSIGTFLRPQGSNVVTTSLKYQWNHEKS